MRPKDEDGRSLPPPHVRLDNVEKLEQAGVFAISQDRRSAALTLQRKLTMVRKVIDHIVDGDKAPGWISKKDPDDPENKAMYELWTIAERAVSEARRSA